jgi:hypothetical protein
MCDQFLASKTIGSFMASFMGPNSFSTGSGGSSYGGGVHGVSFGGMHGGGDPDVSFSCGAHVSGDQGASFIGTPVITRI